MTIASTSTTSMPARARSTRITIRSLLCRSVKPPASGAKSSGGSPWKVAAKATKNASSVSDATSSGPAAKANPSPRLVSQDDGNSQ